LLLNLVLNKWCIWYELQNALDIACMKTGNLPLFLKQFRTLTRMNYHPIFFFIHIENYFLQNLNGIIIYLVQAINSFLARFAVYDCFCFLYCYYINSERKSLWGYNVIVIISWTVLSHQRSETSGGWLLSFSVRLCRML
jgi:hypothetical protein